MSALRGPSVELVAPVLIGYLSKIRGTPAQRIVDVLVAHGIVTAHSSPGSESGISDLRHTGH